LGYHYGDFMRKRKCIMVSGGFDPVHVGHVRMIKEAARKASLIVVINSDDWLMRKKGYVFMPWEERAEIIRAIEGVATVVPVDDTDGTVCEALHTHKPDYFANGGDRTANNTPEMQVCAELGIEMVWNVGGEKIQSSSELVEKQNKEKDTLSEIKLVDVFSIE